MMRTAIRDKGRGIVFAALVALAAALPAGAPAHEGATGVVKERMELMEDLGRALKALAPMVKGQAPFDAARVKAYARLIR
ncbi:MAG: hypothetical protein VW405_05580 [Rhodospirillaceae bacterium]